MTLRDARITLRSSFTYHCIIGAAESPAAFFHDDRDQPGKESDELSIFIRASVPPYIHPSQIDAVAASGVIRLLRYSGHRIKKVSFKLITLSLWRKTIKNGPIYPNI